MSRPERKRKRRIRTHARRVTAELVRRIERSPTGRILLAEARHQSRVLREQIRIAASRQFLRSQPGQYVGFDGLDLL